MKRLITPSYFHNQIGYIFTKRMTYIYSLKYDYHYEDLCKLESRQLFGKEETDKLIFSDIKVDPSVSPFLKCRFEIISTADSYPTLLKQVQAQAIKIEDFTAEYLILDGDTMERPKRRSIQRDIGYAITGEPNFTEPTIIYSVCRYKELWYFGVLTKHKTGWHLHNEKPCSFSNSIDIHTAKALVSIAAKVNKSNTLIDTCCGVGTILLEACFSGFTIEGCDIEEQRCEYTRQNLSHYGYSAKAYHSDIKDITKEYNAAIVDLPYNFYAASTDSIAEGIIESAARVAQRVVIVSTADIYKMITEAGLSLLDQCSVEKRGDSTFTRTVWVCERSH